jgi:superfamily II DNA helicase RecQ
LKLKILTFQFCEHTKGFDDKQLQDFISDKEIIDFSEYFYVHENTPYLTVLISYRFSAVDEKRKFDRRSDPRRELDEVEKQIYDALRNWRGARARQEGVPPYMIANNKQLAKMVKLRATTKSALAKVDGIGEAKIAKYGDEISQIIVNHPMTETVEKPEKEKDAEP